MSEFIAGAFVDVRPEIKNFRSELKRQVDAAIKNSAAFKIPVTVDPRGIKKTIADAAKGQQIKVPIVAGTSATALRKSFKDIVDAASRNLKATVTVDVKASKTATTTAPKIAKPPPVEVPIKTSTSIADLKKEIKRKIDSASEGQKIVIPIDVKGIEKLPKQRTPTPVPVTPVPVKTAPTPRIAAAAKAEAIKVPVTISTTVAQLKEAIKSKIDSAKKGLKIEIPVEAKGTGKAVPIPKAPAQTAPATTRAAPAATTPKPPPILVPIKISTTVEELKAAIKAKIDSAQKGQKIVVPIETPTGAAAPTGTAPAPRQPRQRGTAGGSTADQITKSNDRAEQSTKKLTEAQKRQQLVAATVKKSENDLAIATRLFAQANEANISSEERSQRLREARAASTKAAKASNDLLATSEQTLTTKQKSALETRVALAQSLRTDVATTQAKVAADRQATAIEQKSVEARKNATTAMAFEAKEVQDLNALHLKENEVLAAEAALKRQSNAARKQGLTSVAQENEATQKLIVAQKEAIATRRQALKGDTAAARTQKTVGRGIASSALSLLGVRGAVLAASGAFLVGAAAAGVFTKAVKEFTSLETELNVFQATTAATAEQMKEVAKVAHDLGADITLPAVSATDAAQAMSSLARAGLSVRDSIAGARGVLELAAAAQISNADAAELTASALNAFGLSGEHAVQVADLLANAANNAQGSISEMGAALQQSSAIAHQVGLSLQNTVATLTIFARHGLRGSDAGTSLRTALSRLIAPTSKASELIGQLGLNLRDANGNIRPDVFAQFGEATKDISPALRDMIAETLAGQDAIRAFAIGAAEGRRGLKLAQLQMEATGTAAELAAARSRGLGGSFSALQSNTETLGTSLGKLAGGPVKAVVGGLNQLVVAASALATGDFSKLGEIADTAGSQFEANMKRHFEGAKKIVGGTDFSSLGQGLKELFTPAPGADKQQQHIQNLTEALSRLQSLRVQAFTIGADIGPITQQIQRVRAELKAAKVDAGVLIPVTPLEKALSDLRDAQHTAEEFKRDALATGAAPGQLKFIDDILRNINVRIKLTTKTFKDNAKKMGQSLEDVKAPDIAKSFEKQFDLIAKQPLLATPDVIAALNQLAGRIKGTAPLTGAAGKEIGQRLMDSITAIIAQAVKDDNPELAQDMKALAQKIATLFGGSLGEAFKGIKVPLTDQQLEDALLPQRIKTARAEAFGTVSDQIAAKQGELDSLNKQLTQVVKGSTQEETILGKISAAKDAIRSLREQQASDQKQKDTKSDKKVTDALSGRERTLTQKLTKAQATETLKDDLQRERDLKVFYAQEIKTIKATVKDADNRRSALAEAQDNLFKIEQQIQEDRAGRREQLRAIALKPIDDAAERASETETLKDDLKNANRKVRFWQTQVRNLKELVRQRKATADELKKAQDALDEAERTAAQVRRDRKAQIRDQREQGLELDIEFAQTNENKNKEIKARNAFIAFLEQEKKSFKGNILRLKQIRNQIAEQKKAIKDLKGDVSGDQGTTVFELLQQNAETFKANAGNLISGNQPFAGPAGFTADIAQFLIRQKKAADDLAKASKSSAAAISSVKAPKIAANKVVSRGGGVLKDVTVPTVPAPKIPPEKVVSRGGGPLFPPETKIKTDSVKSTDFQNLTGAVVKLTNVLERQPGVGKTSTTSARRQPQSSDRTHYSVATASRRVVEERTGI